MGGEQNAWCRNFFLNKRRGEQTVVMVNKLCEHRVDLWVQLWATEKLVNNLVNILVNGL